MTDEEKERALRSIAQTPDELLLNELLIENHNIESCARKMQSREYGKSESLLELFTMFTERYSLIFDEILRRMKRHDLKRQKKTSSKSKN